MRKYSCRNLEDRQPGSDSGLSPKQGDAHVFGDTYCHTHAGVLMFILMLHGCVEWRGVGQ